MTHDMIGLLSQYGLAVVFANVLLEQIGLPIPAIPTLVVAGALAVTGQLSLPLVIVVALAACLLADAIWYLIGRAYGNGVMKTLCRISLTPDSCVSETQSRFERWGLNALVLAKFVPGLSLIAPPLAGATRISLPSFLLYDAAGSALWIGAGVGGGALFGRQIDYVLGKVEQFGARALVVLGVLLALYIAFKWWERQRFYKKLRMARISVEELYRLMQDGHRPVVVDVRSATARGMQPQRIPGAVHMTLDSVEARAHELPRDRDIILYCTCPNEATAAHAAKTLMRHGITRVRPLYGGLDAWVAAGYAVEVIAELDQPAPVEAVETMET